MNTELFEEKLEKADEILARLMHNYVHHLEERRELMIKYCSQLKSLITDVELFLHGQRPNSEPSATIAANSMLGGPKAEQLSCGCTPMQRTMITFTKDGDYCGGCGKLIPTT